jgi:ELWxxDGT repeat protein
MFQGWWKPRQESERGRLREFHPSIEVLEDRTLLSVTLVGDINQTTQPAFTPGSAQISSAQVGNWTYFSASDGLHANELWRSNGTASGTALVKAIDGPGLTPDMPSTIDHLTALGNQVFFTVDDGVHGNEVWISDGTAAGTHLLVDINKGQDLPPGTDGVGSNADDFVVVGNDVFFTAEDATHGRELWVSDGTSNGTYLVRDLDPFNTVPDSIGPTDLTAYNGQVYFYASDGLHGRELWTTDGSKDGTRMVADLNRGAADGAPQDDSITFPGSTPGPMMAVMGNYLYFVGNNGFSGEEIFRTDGTWHGTSEVRDIRGRGQASADPRSLTVVNGLLYFTADDGIHGRSLWDSDGTSQGTHIVAGPNMIGFESLQDIRQVTAFGTRIAFISTTTDGGEGLWVSDGSKAGTRMLKEIAPQQTLFPPLAHAEFIPWESNTQELLVNGSLLYFTAYDPVHGRELWKTDGTLPGTALVRDIRYGPAGSEITLIAGQGNHILLAANDGRFGRELWTSDGTFEGTRQIRDINTLPNDANPSSPVQAGNNLFFAADDGVHGEQLWMLDGTTGKTRMVAYINQTVGPTWLAGGDMLPQGADIHDMIALNGRVYFGANDGIHGDELWVSDGTVAGTHMVKDINTQPPLPWLWGSSGINGGASISQLLVLNGQLYFTANDGIHGDELWTSDGTSAGTHLVKDIDTQNSAPVPIPLVYQSGGTPASAQAAIPPNWNFGNDSSYPTSLTVMGNRLFFAASDGVHGNELWVSDGTDAGTVMLRNINPEAAGANPTPEDSNPTDLTRVGAYLFFAADDGIHGTELWRTNGTTQGTVPVQDINRTTSTPFGSSAPVPGSSFPSNLTAVGNSLYFTADDGVSGIGLWKSDGTGTRLIRSLGSTLVDGETVSVSEMTAVGSRLFFSSNAGNAGFELWTSDGTTAGTNMVLDLYPGSTTISDPPNSIPNSSSPAGLTSYQGKVYFIATDSTNGRELWSSDGTAVGTVLVQNVMPGQGGGLAGATGITVIGNSLYFSGSNGKTGNELWKLS